MKKSLVLMTLFTALLATNASADSCFSSNVNVVSNSYGQSVNPPGLVCVKNLKAVNVSRYSGEVVADLRVGMDAKTTVSRIFNISFLEDGKYKVNVSILSDDDSHTCSEGVSYDVKIEATFDRNGDMISLDNFYGYGIITPDTCHGPYDYVELNYTPVRYERD